MVTIICFNSILESVYWTKTNYAMIKHLPMKNYELTNKVLFLVTTGFLLLDAGVILFCLV